MRSSAGQTQANSSRATVNGGQRGAKLTLDAFFCNIYLPYVKSRKRSWYLDERIARRHLSPIFGSSRLDAISTFDVERWLANLKASGLAPATCNRILATLKSIFTLAEAYGHILFGSSPCKYVRHFKLLPHKERFLTVREGKKLLELLGKSDKLEAKAIQLLLLTGARKSEILKARWEHLDCERRVLTVPVSKSGKTRHIFLSERAVKVFSAIPRDESVWIFPGRNPEKPISDIYHFWNKTRLLLGLGDVRLHDLRHSYASYLVSAGHTLYEAQQLLGHSDPRMTMRYAHFAQQTLVRAAGSVASLLVKFPAANRHKSRDAIKRQEGRARQSGICRVKRSKNVKAPGD